MATPDPRDEILCAAALSGKLDGPLANDPDAVEVFAAFQKLESLFAFLRQPGTVVAQETVLSQPTQVGRFLIRRVLGQGAFGTVYLADDPELHRQVAIKVSRRDKFSSADDARLFLEEARSAARLTHPGIVTVHDVGREKNLCWIVLEYVDGTTLEEEIDNKRIPPARAAEIIAEVAESLHYAHKQGFFHRDLKPGNILLDSQGNLRVADFGLAVSEDSQRLQAGQVAGTPAYMSPEQVRGDTHRLDGRTDIWSLGVIFYELLTGRQPFWKGNLQHCFDDILNREPRPPRQIDDSLPTELERICLKALSKSPTERYTTARDMAQELRHALKPASSRVPLVIVSAIGVVLVFGAFVAGGLLRGHNGIPEDTSNGVVASLALPHSDVGEEQAPRQQARIDHPDEGSEGVSSLTVPQPDRNTEPTHRATRPDHRATGNESKPLASIPSPNINEEGSRQRVPPEHRVTDDESMPSVAVPPPDRNQEQLHRRKRADHREPPELITNSVGMKLVLISPGQFQIGSSQKEIDQVAREANGGWEVGRIPHEGPQRSVQISQPFYLGMYEVTESEYQEVMGTNPSQVQGGPDSPVEAVSWNDAMEFCQRLTELPAERAASRGYRLPSEAEWEYACRAGATGRYCFGNDKSELDDYGWVACEGKNPVGQKRPNTWGLYDMHGNVWEWCADWYGQDYYSILPPNDPTGPAYGTKRVFRGGSFGNGEVHARCAFRQYGEPGRRNSSIGFRVVMTFSP